MGSLSFDDKVWIENQLHRHNQFYEHKPGGCVLWVIVIVLLLILKNLGGC